jgi:signal transduction histidine kinase
MMDAVAVQPGAVTPSDLAELMSAFNEVTGRLQSTHESLRREVVRLQDELRDANEQLQRSRRLAALGEMAAGIAHEVRNPLGSIRLYARLLEQDLTDRPQERAVATRIAAAVHGLDGVVGDVLSFAREIRVRAEPADAGALIERALEACWDPSEAACIRVEHRDSRRRGGLRRGVRARLTCDPALMHQVLVNIIRNALQAMGEAPAPEGGHLLAFDVGPEMGEDRRAAFGIAVSDTGPGISAETIDRMFNPFFTTRAAGTGLGLAIVHRIVDAHGGRIQVRSRTDGPDRGTTFRLLLPARDGGEDHGAAREAAKRSRRPGP